MHPIKILPVACALAIATACGSPGGASDAGATEGVQGESLKELMAARGLTEADVNAALKTYTPTGKKDEYYIFASGGHGGNLIVIGVPSMRILKYIGVFTPEPWQGYGYG